MTSSLQNVFSLLIAQGEQRYTEVVLTTAPEPAPKAVSPSIHPANPSRHFLPGRLPHELFEHLQSENFDRMELQARMSPLGVAYLLIAQQCEDWQHRFLIPLVGEQVKEWLLDALAQPPMVAWQSLSAQDRLTQPLVMPCKAIEHRAPWATVAKAAKLAELPVRTTINDCLAWFDELNAYAAQLLEVHIDAHIEVQTLPDRPKGSDRKRKQARRTKRIILTVVHTHETQALIHQAYAALRARANR